MSASDIFDRLMLQIHERARTLPPGSYTTKLITGGVPAMGEKVLEEAGEVVEAAAALQAAQTAGGSPSSVDALAERQHLIYEAGDVIYHLWVLLGSFGVTVDEVRQELERREGTSGLEEKRQRSEPE
jgi:phosphoribosyl-ATP pyrophosphohydrolase